MNEPRTNEGLILFEGVLIVSQRRTDKWNQLIAPKYLTDTKLLYKEGTATIQPEDMYLKGWSKSPK